MTFCVIVGYLTDSFKLHNVLLLSFILFGTIVFVVYLNYIMFYYYVVVTAENIDVLLFKLHNVLLLSCSCFLLTNSNIFPHNLSVINFRLLFLYFYFSLIINSSFYSALFICRTSCVFPTLRSDRFLKTGFFLTTRQL